MNYSFILALILSLVWHSFAFVLFKLAEPYHIKPEKYEIVNVDFISTNSLTDSQLDSLRKIDFLDVSRFSLPSESGQRMPSPEINVDLQKKMSYLDTKPIYEKTLIKHRPIIAGKIVDLGFDDNLNKINLDYTYPPEKYVNYALLQDDSEKKVFFSFRGINIKPIEHGIPEKKIILSTPLTIKFSLDNMGNIKSAIIEKTSGDTETDKVFLEAFKKWRFEKTLIFNELDIHETQLRWGNVVFYLN